jgi:hypothetical protein
MWRRVLVPLVVVGVALALWFWPERGDDPRHDFGSDVRECTQNLRTIYAGLRRYHELHGTLPQGSGAAFLLELLGDALPDDAEHRAALTCPGPGAEPVPPGLDLSDLAKRTPSASAYAGRDMVHFPLTKFPSGGAELEPLAACDNAEGWNHDKVLNVLYSDGSVVTLSLERLVEQNRVPPGTTVLPVGPDSPLEELRKLSD